MVTVGVVGFPFDTISLSFFRLESMGGLEWYKVVHQHQGWRLVSCIWLHAGVIHVLANMLSLIFIGIRLEQQFGFGMLLNPWGSIDLCYAWRRKGYLIILLTPFHAFWITRILNFPFFPFSTVRVGLIYLLSGLGGSILSSLFIRNSISVGASGALFGLLGAMLSELLINWTIYTNKVWCSPQCCVTASSNQTINLISKKRDPWEYDL